MRNLVTIAENVGQRLVLIMPPQTGLIGGFANGLISMANYVTAHSQKTEVEILDLSSSSWEEVLNRIRFSSKSLRKQRLFIGVTTTTASYRSALVVAKIVRAEAPEAVIVFGGPHAGADPENILRDNPDLVDLIIVGEGEKPLLELIRHYPDLQKVTGAVFISNYKFKHTPAPVPLTSRELDSIPITYKDIGMVGTPGKFEHATYVSARGCPLSCAFCAVGNSRIRAKSIPVVIKDVMALIHMGYSRIAIEDNFFAQSAARTKNLCIALKKIKKQYDKAFTWDCQTRIESLVRKDIIPLMAEAGCEAVYIGVESVLPEHLLYLEKTRNPDRYLQQLADIVVPALLENRIACYMNLQFGLPGETLEHDTQTQSFLYSLGQKAVLNKKVITVFPQLHVVYPGTKHYLRGVAEGRFPPSVFERFTYWEYHQPPVLRWLGEHFAHGAGGIPEGILRRDLLTEPTFEVDSNAVVRISAGLHAIDRIPGIKVFDYGDYIVPSAIINNGKSAGLVRN
jgi:radical SAM superfamily enzyme YgiQ (UPF0313 family)